MSKETDLRRGQSTSVSELLQDCAQSTLSPEEFTLSELPLPQSQPLQMKVGQRYKDLGPLGRGGMGEVRRVYDRDLNRIIAMKIVRERLLSTPRLQQRFLKEAQTTARLQHPNIVPVHDFGRLPDGRFYFTMREVKGKTLSALIRGLHRASSSERWSSFGREQEWDFHRLVSSLQQLCDAVSYAHRERILHRDIKPDNVMLGPYGEVLLLDWGITKWLAASFNKEPQESQESQNEALTERPTPYALSGESDDEGEEGETMMTVAPEALAQEDEPSSAGQSGQRDHHLSASKPTRDDTQAVVSITTSPIDFLTKGEGATGTPLYMPPEQLSDQHAPLAETADIYCLGGCLYELLTGAPPFKSTPSKSKNPTTEERLAVREKILWPADSTKIPEPLREITERALSFHPDQRYQSAAELGRAIRDWLSGVQRRGAALRCVAEASSLEMERVALIAAAKTELSKVEKIGVPKPWSSEEEKTRQWRHEDRAAELRFHAELLAIQSEDLLQRALLHDSTLHEAHLGLAERARCAHHRAELVRDHLEAERALLRLRGHCEALPAALGDQLRRYLEEEREVQIFTDPPLAELTVALYQIRRRRLQLGSQRRLNCNSEASHTLSLGTHLLQLSAEGYQRLDYPIYIERAQPWSQIAPGEETPSPIQLLPIGVCPEGFSYIPAGWFYCGGDEQVSNAPSRRRLWQPSFIIQKKHITHREYLAYLNALVERGDEVAAKQALPQSRDEEGSWRYEQVDGLYQLPQNHRSLMEVGVSMITWYQAKAYIRWRADHEQIPWRLPREMEWEKVARSVDGRFFPWGDQFDPAWCVMRESFESAPRPLPAEERPTDQGLGGVLSLSGNLRDWCEDPFNPEFSFPPQSKTYPLPLEMGEDGEPEKDRVVRGGSWKSFEGNCRVAFRFIASPAFFDEDGGFRLACSLDDFVAAIELRAAPEEAQ